MAFTNPQVTDFKTRFYRDFPYNPDPNQGVTDMDINLAFGDVNTIINTDLFPDQSTYFLAYLYLTAHSMCMNIRAGSQGVGGGFAWAQTQKSVGNVSESYQIPQRVIDNPMLMMFTKTSYGARYLEIILPFLVGQMFAVCGRTKP